MNRSEKFVRWLTFLSQDASEIENGVTLLTDLEQAARLVAHQYQLMGDVPSSDLAKLSKAVEALKEAYEGS